MIARSMQLPEKHVNILQRNNIALKKSTIFSSNTYNGIKQWQFHWTSSTMCVLMLQSNYSKPLKKNYFMWVMIYIIFCDLHEINKFKFPGMRIYMADPTEMSFSGKWNIIHIEGFNFLMRSFDCGIQYKPKSV